MFICEMLKQKTLMESLHWFDSVVDRLKEPTLSDAVLLNPPLRTPYTVSSNLSVTTESFDPKNTVKDVFGFKSSSFKSDLQSKYLSSTTAVNMKMEFEMLFYSINGARLFFT